MGYLRFLSDNAPWLLAGFLLTLSSSYGQTFFISIFAGQFRQEFGLSHGAWGGIYSLGTTASALIMIWAGTLADRFRVRVLAPVVLALLALACLALSVTTSAWMLVFVIFALRLTGQGMASHIAMVGVARWFVATRGKAMTIASLGFAVGTAIMPLIFVALLATWHWRSLWVLAAGLCLAAIPVLVLLLRRERTPRHDSDDTEGRGMDDRHWTRIDMMRHPMFWLIFPSYLGPAAWGTALFFQQVHLSEVKGWSLQDFVALFPIFTAASIAMSFATGWAVDRFSANRLMPLYLLPWAIAFAILASADSLWLAGIGMAFAGLAVGTGAVLPGAFLAEHYGTRYLGGIKSAAAAIMVLGSAIGPGITGYLIDLGIDFPDQMAAISAYFVIALLLAGIGARSVRGSFPAT